MIQFNLLPDVKLDFIRTRRRKRLVALISVCMAGGSVALLVLLLLVVKVWQLQSIKGIEKDITTNNNTLQSITDIGKVLTVQAQLGSLNKLHDEKPLASRMFVYLSQITPATATISQVTVDFPTSTLTVAGAADTLQTINTYADTIKFTDYTSATQTTPIRAFKDVVLTNYAPQEKSATYEISIVFDKNIFDAKQDAVSLIVPKLVTTRSELSKPGLFDASEGVPQ